MTILSLLLLRSLLGSKQDSVASDRHAPKSGSDIPVQLNMMPGLSCPLVGFYSSSGKESNTVLPECTTQWKIETADRSNNTVRDSRCGLRWESLVEHMCAGAGPVQVREAERSPSGQTVVKMGLFHGLPWQLPRVRSCRD